VEEVWVSVDTGLVVVAGTSLDASLLRWRVQSKIRKYRVDIVSDGGAAEEPPRHECYYAQPPPGYPYDPCQYAYYGGGGMVPQQLMGFPPAAYARPAAPHTAGALGWVPNPPQHLLQYVPGELLHARRRYTPNEAPLWFNNNDDENPNGCCSVQ
jgi:hypothetical protein